MKDGGNNGCMMPCRNLFDEVYTYAGFAGPILDTSCDSSLAAWFHATCCMLGRIEAACAWTCRKPHDAAGFVMAMIATVCN